MIDEFFMVDSHGATTYMDCVRAASFVGRQIIETSDEGFSSPLPPVILLIVDIAVRLLYAL